MWPGLKTYGDRTYGSTDSNYGISYHYILGNRHLFRDAFDL